MAVDARFCIDFQAIIILQERANDNIDTNEYATVWICAVMNAVCCVIFYPIIICQRTATISAIWPQMEMLFNFHICLHNASSGALEWRKFSQAAVATAPSFIVRCLNMSWVTVIVCNLVCRTTYIVQWKLWLHLTGIGEAFFETGNSERASVFCCYATWDLNG